MNDYNSIISELKGAKPEESNSYGHVLFQDPNHNFFQYLIPLMNYSIIVGLNDPDATDKTVDVLEILDDTDEPVSLSISELAYLKADLAELNYSII